MQKRAQITLFVIIAVLIVAAAVLGIVYSKEIIAGIKGTTLEQVKLAENEVDSCMDTNSKEAVEIISLQGGSISPVNYISDRNLHVNYWYANGADVSPGLEIIESELSDAICILLKNCVNFEQYGLNATKGECSAITKINANSVDFEVNYPIKIEVSDETYLLNKFSTKIQLRLREIYMISKEIVEEQTKHPDSVCLTCNADLAAENDLLISIGSSEEGLLVNIKDNVSKIYSNQTSEFQFGMMI